MADQEHLDILRQGVDVWNQWRKKHLQDKRPDLRGAALRSGALRGINLYAALLSGADLSQANLQEANLFKADLSQANLSQADLGSANLYMARLVEANLQKANLAAANLNRTLLNGANLNEVRMYHTILGDVDLHLAMGLDAVLHGGPSSIGIDTIYRSRGQIPESFLREAGVPETFLTNMRALIESTSPINFYSCFISYSSKDQDFARRLYADLQSRRIRCWFAPEDLKIGDKIRPRIDESIHLQDKLLLVLSQHSVASQWVEQEVETALERERKEKRTVLFPIRLDNTVIENNGGWPALIRNTRNIGDFTCWKDHDAYLKAFERLLRDLKAEYTTKGDEAQ